MPTYVVLYKFTEQGRKKIKSTVRRAEEIRRDNERRGFSVLGTWWTQGQYDLITVVDAPSDAAMMAGLANIAAVGNVSSESLRAYSQRQMMQILQTAGRKPARKTAARKTARKRPPARKTARRRR